MSTSDDPKKPVHPDWDGEELADQKGEPPIGLLRGKLNVVEEDAPPEG